MDKLKKKLEKNFIEPLNGTHFEKSRELKVNLINFSKFSNNVIEYFNKDLNLELDNQIKEIKKVQKELEDEKFTIAVFGFFSSGKSTFLNVLMKTDILPMDESRITANFTRLRHIKDKRKLNKILIDIQDYFFRNNKKNNYIEIVYKDKSTIFNLYKEALNNLGFDEKDYSFNKLKNFRNKLLEKVEKKRFKDFPIIERDKIKNSKKILKFILSNKIPYGKSIKIKKEDVKEYLTDDNKAIAISEVIYYLDNDLLKDVEIIDTLGFGSENRLDTKKTIAFLKEVDAVILLTPSTAPLGTSEEQEFLENYAKIFSKNGEIDTSKFFVILNKIDTTTKSREEVKKLFFKTLEENWKDEFKLKDNHLFTLSAKYHFDLLTKNSSEIKSENINENDLEEFKKVYSSYLTKEKDKTIIANNLRKIDDIIFNVETSLKNKIDKINLELEDIKRRKEQLYRNRDEIKKIFENYNDVMDGILFILSENIKKELDLQELSRTNAIERTTKAYKNYLKSLGLKISKVNEKNAKIFYKMVIKETFNKINNESIELLKEKIDQKIELLNREIKELKMEDLKVKVKFNKTIINECGIGELKDDEIEFEIDIFNKILNIYSWNNWLNINDYVKQMIKKWNEEYYDFLYNKIMENDKKIIENIKNKLNNIVTKIDTKTDEKLNELEKNILKEEKMQKEYQKKLDEFENILDYYQKYKYKIKTQYKDLYFEPC